MGLVLAHAAKFSHRLFPRNVAAQFCDLIQDFRVLRLLQRMIKLSNTVR